MGARIMSDCKHEFVCDFLRDLWECPKCGSLKSHFQYSQYLEGVIAELKKIIYAAKEYDESDDDAGWEAPHPIFQMAQENDHYRWQIGRLIERARACCEFEMTSQLESDIKEILHGVKGGDDD